MGPSVVAVDPRPEHVRQLASRLDGLQMVRALLAHRSPEPFHQAPRFGVVGLCVHQPDLQPLRHRGENVSAVAGTVVDVEDAACLVLHQRRAEHAEEVDFRLGLADLERDDVAAAVVDDGVDLPGPGLTGRRRRPDVADVRMPEIPCCPGAPAAPVRATGGPVQAVAGQAVGAEQPAQGVHRDLALRDEPVADGLGEDQLGGGGGMGASHVEQGLALGVVEGEGEATLAGPGLERANAPTSLDEPALQGLPVEGARAVTAGRAVAAASAQLELGCELSEVEIADEQVADDGEPKGGDRFGVCGLGFGHRVLLDVDARPWSPGIGRKERDHRWCAGLGGGGHTAAPRRAWSMRNACTRCFQVVPGQSIRSRSAHRFGCLQRTGPDRWASRWSRSTPWRA